MGTTSSITRFGVDDLVVEAMAPGIMAWLSDEDDLAHVERAVSFLTTKRKGSGRFGSTQATIMALRAIAQFAEQSRTLALAGEVTVYVNDLESQWVPFADGPMEPVEVSDFAEAPPDLPRSTRGGR